MNREREIDHRQNRCQRVFRKYFLHVNSDWLCTQSSFMILLSDIDLQLTCDEMKERERIKRRLRHNWRESRQGIRLGNYWIKRLRGEKEKQLGYVWARAEYTNECQLATIEMNVAGKLSSREEQKNVNKQLNTKWEWEKHCKLFSINLIGFFAICRRAHKNRFHVRSAGEKISTRRIFILDDQCEDFPR